MFRELDIELLTVITLDELAEATVPSSIRINRPLQSGVDDARMAHHLSPR